MILLIAIFYCLALFIIAAVLIHIIEHELKFTHILLFHALLVVLSVSGGLDGFMMFFSIIDLLLVFYISNRSEQP